jgi:hypothetical protein
MKDFYFNFDKNLESQHDNKKTKRNKSWIAILLDILSIGLIALSLLSLAFDNKEITVVNSILGVVSGALLLGISEIIYCLMGINHQLKKINTKLK